MTKNANLSAKIWALGQRPFEQCLENSKGGKQRHHNTNLDPYIPNRGDLQLAFPKPQRRVARMEDLKGAGGKDKEEKKMRGGTRMDGFPPKLTHRDSPQDQGKALFTTFSHVATTQDSFKQSIMSWFNFLPPSTNYTSDRRANFSMRMKDNALVYPLDLIDLINLSSFLSSRPRQWVERQDMTGFDLMGTLPCPGRA